jgi:flagellar basal-body rod modification protein FlgD
VETKKSNDVGQEDFLKLMVTQMQHQDPMKPMENGEFLTQIAQFSQASGIKDLQDSFSQFSAAMTSNQALQASSLVGRSVLVPAGQGVLTDSMPLQGKINIPSSTSQLTFSITDASGQLVRRVDMGSQAAGEFPFQWDGTDDDGNAMPAGIYTVKAEMVQGNQTVSLDTDMVVNVQSVTVNGSGQGITLNLAGLGQIDFKSVKEIL